MGVDYSPVGGVGIEVTDDIRDKLIIKNKGEYDECMHELLDDLEIPYKEAGNNYSGGDMTFYMVVEGATLKEVNKNAEDFIKTLTDADIKVSFEDLVIIEDLHVW